MAVMEVSYRERRRKLGRSDFVSNMDVAAFTVVLLRRRRSESNCIRGGGERRRGRYNCEATFFEILIFEATFEKPKNSILNLDKLRQDESVTMDIRRRKGRGTKTKRVCFMFQFFQKLKTKEKKRNQILVMVTLQLGIRK